MKNKFKRIGFAVLIGTTVLSFNSPASANTDIQAVEDELSQTRNELDALYEQMKRSEQAVKDNYAMIQKTEGQIAGLESELVHSKKEQAKIEDKIKVRGKILDKRLRSMQTNGNEVQYIDLLLGSANFEEFIGRANLISTVMKSDRELIEEHQKDIKEADKRKKEIEKKVHSAKEAKIELEGMKELILDQKRESEKLKAQLKEKEQGQLSKKEELERQAAEEAAAKAEEAAAENTVAEENDVIADEGKAETPTPTSGHKEENAQQPGTVQAETSQPATVQANKSVVRTKASRQPSPAKKSSASKPAASPVKKVAASKPSGSAVSIVTTVGNKYIGNSVYVFGGGRSASDVAKGRFDCSGFVHWAYSQAGVSVGSSTDSLKYGGRQVPASQMAPGDMVFFNTYKTDGHVGIYLGGGRFIGSQSSTGVAIANMSSGYWKKAFNGRVVRVL